MKKKIISLMFTVVLSLSCIISVYGNEGSNIVVAGDDGIAVCSSNVISTIIAQVSLKSNKYSGSVTMQRAGTGTFTIYLWKKNSSGTYKIIDQKEKYFTSAYNVSLSDYSSKLANSGTYKCSAECVAHSDRFQEAMVVHSIPVTR